MKHNHYESVVIINAALDDEQVNSTITKIEDYLLSKESKIAEIEKWGRKRLAYPIQKSKSGYYALLRFEAETSVIKDLERLFRLDENIIRYLTIVLDANDLENIQKLKEKEEAKASEEAVVEAAVVEEAKEVQVEKPSEKVEESNETEA